MSIRVEMPTSYVNEKLGELTRHINIYGLADLDKFADVPAEVVARCRDLCHALELEFDNWLTQAYALEAERRAADDLEG